jgi:hypothetical protein
MDTTTQCFFFWGRNLKNSTKVANPPKADEKKVKSGDHP